MNAFVQWDIAETENTAASSAALTDVPTSSWMQIRWFAPNKHYRSYGALNCQFRVQWIAIVPFPASYTVLLAVGKFLEAGGGFSPNIQGLVRHTKAARPAPDDESTWRELSKLENFSTLTTLKNVAQKYLRIKKLWTTQIFSKNRVFSRHSATGFFDHFFRVILFFITLW